MTNVALLSKHHFAAYNQVVEDYKSLIALENELSRFSDGKRKTGYNRIKNEIVMLLERIIKNKTILKENTLLDDDYLNQLKEKKEEKGLQ